MIYLTKGKTTPLLFTLKNEFGGVIDLTGLGVTFIIRDKGDIVFTLRSTDAGGSDAEVLLLDATNGKIKVFIDSSLTGDLVHRDMVANIYVGVDSVSTIAVRFFPFTDNTNISYQTHGVTADRPDLPQGVYVGFTYFDTTLNVDVIWNGATWVDNVDELDTKIAANTANIVLNDDDITALDGRVTVNEGDITTLEGYHP